MNPFHRPFCKYHNITFFNERPAHNDDTRRHDDQAAEAIESICEAQFSTDPFGRYGVWTDETSGSGIGSRYSKIAAGLMFGLQMGRQFIFSDQGAWVYTNRSTCPQMGHMCYFQRISLLQADDLDQGCPRIHYTPDELLKAWRDNDTDTEHCLRLTDNNLLKTTGSPEDQDWFKYPERQFLSFGRQTFEEFMYGQEGKPLPCEKRYFCKELSDRNPEDSRWPDWPTFMELVPWPKLAEGRGCWYTSQALQVLFQPGPKLDAYARAQKKRLNLTDDFVAVLVRHGDKGATDKTGIVYSLEVHLQLVQRDFPEATTALIVTEDPKTCAKAEAWNAAGKRPILKYTDYNRTNAPQALTALRGPEAESLNSLTNLLLAADARGFVGMAGSSWFRMTLALAFGRHSKPPRFSTVDTTGKRHEAFYWKRNYGFCLYNEIRKYWNGDCDGIGGKGCPTMESEHEIWQP